MDVRVEEALRILKYYRDTFIAEPVVRIPEVREYIAEIDQIRSKLEDVGNEISQKILKAEIAGKGKDDAT